MRARPGRWLAGALRPAALGLAGLPCATASAHGFGQRFDLPVPLELYLLGSGATVALSFAVIALFGRARDRGQVLRTRPLPAALARVLAWPIALAVVRTVSVAVFAVAVSAGLWGTQDPAHNILPTLVWIIWWTGMAYVCALVGDLWSVVNPWAVSFSWLEAVHARLRPGRRFGLGLRVPSWLGVWPGLAAFGIFVWAELIWPDNAVPARLAWAAIAYSAFNWSGMFAFGRRAWLASGDAFAIAFGLFARFAPLGGAARLGWRPYGAALLSDQPISTSLMVFVLAMLATVSFDGFMATPLWREMYTAIETWKPIMPTLFALYQRGFGADLSIPTIGLLLAPLAFVATYLGFAALVTGFGNATAPDRARRRSPGWVARYFVLTLVPIAIAYHLAHYLGFLLTAGQLIIPLASDPFGAGQDLFGSADYRLNIGIVGARFVWYTSVIAIVIGHVIAVYLSHVLALRAFPDRRSALWSQAPMLVLMVAYTCASLWILGQPITE